MACPALRSGFFGHFLYLDGEEIDVQQGVGHIAGRAVSARLEEFIQRNGQLCAERGIGGRNRFAWKERDSLQPQERLSSVSDVDLPAVKISPKIEVDGKRRTVRVKPGQCGESARNDSAGDIFDRIHGTETPVIVTIDPGNTWRS